MAKSLKVGDVVSFKYDVEQSGKIESIKTDWLGAVYFVRAFYGDYVDDRTTGVLVPFRRADLWVEGDE